MCPSWSSLQQLPSSVCSLDAAIDADNISVYTDPDTILNSNVPSIRIPGSGSATLYAASQSFVQALDPTYQPPAQFAYKNSKLEDKLDVPQVNIPNNNKLVKTIRGKQKQKTLL